MSSFTRRNARSPEWRFRMLRRSDERALLEVSSSEHRADKLLVRSLPRINCNLVNSAMSMQTAACSSSLMAPTSCSAWRRRACMCSRMPSAVSMVHPPNVWPLLGELLCCCLPPPEESSLEQVSP